ncbi:hypothetical protein CH63R_05573 [Colletotrichum higginsianum IMI 349063]|uniref:Uncharacterized protein n=2 Tax=Colletotrichum higginsianum TaxID=80884 RepID=A0A1B7YCS4_COLHI|nr:hypothetical protein CH63R_05573 [Colletotrichum higginsianum IMI 349063]OBR09881.1 hypothetical protein CH63R_05573 [Colletotrichum higginsianum IMI 349063]TID06642.1 hypothetical protein CH35J_001528 [Colletotrichum higginsianum]
MVAITSSLRRLTLVWLFGLFTLGLFLVFYHDAAWSAARNWKAPFVTDSGLDFFGADARNKVRVTILESVGTHDEVTSALVTAFGGQPDISLTLMLRQQRYNMQDIMNSFKLASPVSKILSQDDFAALVAGATLPHVLVSTTCELDLDAKAKEFRDLLARGETYLFCLVHHADRWRDGQPVDVIREYLDKGMADFIGLSQHTVDFLHRDTAEHWDRDLNFTAHVLPPVFPVNLPDPDPEGLSLAMQGDYSSGRRNYQHTFEQLGHVIGELRAKAGTEEEKGRKVTLHVIGHGEPPSVPEDLQSNVVFDQDLSYPDFYRTLSGAFTIIPAFADDEYLDRKASSTVPAALIAGAPIVASERLLAAYTYLPREAVWLSEPGEDEMDTIKRFVGDTAGYQERTGKVKETRERLMQDNIKNVGEWIGAAVAKVKAIKEEQELAKGKP